MQHPLKVDDSSDYSDVAIGGTIAVLPMPHPGLQKGETKQMATKTNKDKEKIISQVIEECAKISVLNAIADHYPSDSIGVAKIPMLCEHIDHCTIMVFTGSKDQCEKISSLVQFQIDSFMEDESGNKSSVH